MDYAMNVRALRWLWFMGLWLLLPWPLLVVGDAFVPAVRYVLLGSVAATVAVVEGAAGPVGSIVVLLLAWGALTTLLCWLIAWLIARLLSLLPATTARVVTWVCLGAGILMGLFFEPYRTAFGRALTGGLIEILS